MKNFVLPFALIAAFVVALPALRDSVDIRIKTPVVAAPAPPIAPEEQVLILPENGKFYYLTVFVPAAWASDPASRNLKAMIETDPSIARLRATCHYNFYTDADPMYPRYKASITALPCISLQSSDGIVVYKAAGPKIPASPSTLNASLRKALGGTQRYRLQGRGQCPYVKPEPKPEPALPVEPVVPDTEPVVPDTVIEPVGGEDDLSLFLKFALFAGGGVAALYPQFKKRYADLGGS